MKIAVIGATGASGKHFIQHALKKQHDVTALARTPAKLKIQDHRLTVITGDALKQDDVRRAVTGADVVFCALGAGENTGKSTIREQGTQQIVTALAALGQQSHLIVLSSLGVGDSAKQMPLVIRWFITAMLRHPLADHAAQEALVQASSLPWTILRPGSLNDEPSIGTLLATPPPQAVNARHAIPRTDVALFALNVAETGQPLRQALTLTKPV
jgi:putative NADH-flavin reductase